MPRSASTALLWPTSPQGSPRTIFTRADSLQQVLLRAKPWPFVPLKPFAGSSRISGQSPTSEASPRRWHKPCSIYAWPA